MKDPEIIFENDDVLVVDKPSGLSVHGDGDDPTGTLVEWFLNREPGSRGVGEPRVGKDGKELERSGVVHRLDRDTSGVIIMAKNQPAFDHLKTAFQERTVKKVYEALVYGIMKERWGTIARPIGRSNKDWKLRSAERGARGHLRDAVTSWERIVSGQYGGENFSHIRLKPETGRTHQLRVHLKAISRPIVGDSLYGDNLIGKSNNLGLSRLALHATTLTIILPNGDEKTFSSPLPPELASAASLIAD